MLTVKITEVLYVPRIQQWCSILHNQAGAPRVADMCHPKRTLLEG
jgi:hypothetical protein